MEGHDTSKGNAGTSFSKLFNNNPVKAIPLSMETLALYIHELDLEAPEGAWETGDDFVAYLKQCKGAIPIKELFEKCLQENGIDYNIRELRKLTKTPLEQAFFAAFLIGPCDSPDPAPKANPAPEADSGKDNSSAPPISNGTVYMPDFKQLQAIYDRYGAVEKEDFQVSNHMGIVEKMPVNLQDDFYIKIPDASSIYMGCAVLVVSATGKVAAIGQLQDYNGDTHLLFESKCIDYEVFENNYKFKILLFPQDGAAFFTTEFTEEHIASYEGRLYSIECEVQYKKLASTDKPLCIDFGTSNTTVGSFGFFDSDTLSDKIDIVDFLDVTENPPVVKKMLPTIVYVDSCQGSEVQYSFGYEARKKIIEHDYDTTASVYHEIKRWVGDLDREEEIVDESGNKTKVHRSEILQAYIQHIIDSAEQYFKVHFKILHFSAPVKLKESFIHKMKELFDGSDYELMPAHECLDEGVSIIYHYIAEKIRSNSNDQDMTKQEGHVLIMDCGGGTTDLASCSYSCDIVGIGKELKILTGFENGDANFGGNNITYRLLQMLKIKLAGALQGLADVSMQGLIEDENYILQTIDDNVKAHQAMKGDIYTRFEDAYAAAEKWVPTRFAESRFTDEKRWMKRNYYYLWQMAEAIKIEFYKEDLVAVDFNNTDDRKICVSDMEKYYLSVWRNGSLEKYPNPMQNVEITINEIRRVIYPDIYALLNLLLLETVKETELKQYYYKLSGQSCKITLFHDLLKEFIPGYLIRRSNSSRQTDKDSSALKLACISGSIEYIRDKEYGKIKPDIKTKPPQMIYSVSINDENQCILSEQCDVQIARYPLTTRRAKLIIKDKTRNHVIEYAFSEEAGRQCSLLELQRAIDLKTYLTHEATDTIISRILDVVPERINNGEPVICILAVPSKNGYGIHIYQILVKSENDDTIYYLQQDGKFENFENESMETFFNGRR